jgi:hypothetical protein
MEVSKRTLGVLVVVALGVAVARTALPRGPAKPPGQWGRTPERKAEAALRDSVGRLARLVLTDATRDRVDSALSAYPADRVPKVVVIGDGKAAVVAARAPALLDSLGFPSRPMVPVRMALLQAPLSLYHLGVLKNFTILPTPAGPSSCTSVRVVFPGEEDDADQRWGTQRRSWVGSLGPCWYLATFGPPGPGVRQWLDARYWDVARDVPPHREPEPLSEDALGPSNIFLRILGAIPSNFAGGSATLERCATTRPELCEVGLLNSPYFPGHLPAGIVENEWAIAFTGRPYSWLTELPSWAAQSVLATMVDDLGPAKFTAFWTSQAPVAEAFESAAGMRIGKWFGERLQRRLREAGVPDAGRKPSWPSVVGLLGLALGATLWGAQRRQVR